MSGVVGALYLDGRPAQEVTLRAMAEALAHRGPHGAGVWAQGPAGLAHRLLRATPEDEAGPLVGPGGRCVIAWDGRLDNRGALLALLRPGAPVSPASPDAALALHAYLRWGVEGLPALVGDFAFVLWDADRRLLVCARDPMGQRPLHYRHDPAAGWFLCASEVKALLRHPGVPQELDEVQVGLYLMGSFGDAERTLYRGVARVPAGTALLVTARGVARYRFWEPRPQEPIRLGGDGEYAGALRQVFREAVRCRLRAAAPVGATLSGGLDSSSIVCTAAQLLQEGGGPPLHTFSAVYERTAAVDERRYIHAVLERYALRPHLVVADDLLGLQPLRGRYPSWDQPYPVPYQARQEALLRCAADAGVGVLLSGEGGDELLSVSWAHFLSLAKRGRLGRLWRELRRQDAPHRARFYRFFLLALLPPRLQDLYLTLRGRRLPPWVDRDFVRRARLLQAERATRPRWGHRDPYVEAQATGVWWLAQVGMVGYLSPLGLYHGVEVRYPFLDVRVVDFLSRVPPEQKFRLGWSKVVLRHAMEGVLPEPVRLRPDKTNFSPLFHQGLRAGRARLEEVVETSSLARLGYVDAGRLRAAYRRYLAGGAARSVDLLLFFSLEEWLRQVMGSSDGALEVSAGPVPFERPTARERG